MSRPAIAERVAKEAAKLRTLSYAELKDYGMEHCGGSAQAFSKYKRGLLKIGIDFDESKRACCKHAAGDARANATHKLTLFCAADAELDRIGVADKDGKPVCYGEFPYFEKLEQSRAEMEAALKAVWLASKTAEAVQGNGVELILYADAQWLLWANAIDRYAGKARRLSLLAKKHGVVLEVRHIPGKENPADRYSRRKGFKKWHENDLAKLPEKIEFEKA